MIGLIQPAERDANGGLGLDHQTRALQGLANNYEHLPEASPPKTGPVVTSRQDGESSLSLARWPKGIQLRRGTCFSNGGMRIGFAHGLRVPATEVPPFGNFAVMSDTRGSQRRDTSWVCAANSFLTAANSRN
jgi:hypothetical protein